MATESKPIQLNTPCPDFHLKATDGRTVQLSDYQKSKILIVGFTCNHCPYVQAYESRLIKLAASYSKSDAAFVCINSNDEKTYPEDSFENMKKRAQELGFTFDYLRDDTQKAAKDFNAVCTPEFYVYDQNRKLHYHGRLDDNHKDPSAVKTQYLKAAIDSLLLGEAIGTSQTAAMGCSIKWK